MPTSYSVFSMTVEVQAAWPEELNGLQSTQHPRTLTLRPTASPWSTLNAHKLRQGPRQDHASTTPGPRQSYSRATPRLPQAQNLRSRAHRPHSCYGFIVNVQGSTDNNALLNSCSATTPIEIAKCGPVRSKGIFDPQNWVIDIASLEIFLSFQCTKYHQKRWLNTKYIQRYRNTMTKDKMSFNSIIANKHALIKVC